MPVGPRTNEQMWSRSISAFQNAIDRADLYGVISSVGISRLNELVDSMDPILSTVSLIEADYSIPPDVVERGISQLVRSGARGVYKSHLCRSKADINAIKLLNIAIVLLSNHLSKDIPTSYSFPTS